MSKKSQSGGWKKLKKAFDGHLSDEALANFDLLAPEEFLVNYFKLAEYMVPKLARQELVSEDNKDIKITIDYVKSEADQENEGTD